MFDTSRQCSEDKNITWKYVPYFSFNRYEPPDVDSDCDICLSSHLPESVQRVLPAPAVVDVVASVSLLLVICEDAARFVLYNLRLLVGVGCRNAIHHGDPRIAINR